MFLSCSKSAIFEPFKIICKGLDRYIVNNTGLTIHLDGHYLAKIPAKIRFLSIEPLLEDLGKVDFSGIHWVIVGGESGNKARKMKKAWVENIQKQCDEQNIVFFFKQWGTWGADEKKRNKHKNGKLLNNQLYQNYPETKFTH